MTRTLDKRSCRIRQRERRQRIFLICTQYEKSTRKITLNNCVCVCVCVCVCEEDWVLETDRIILELILLAESSFNIAQFIVQVGKVRSVRGAGTPAGSHQGVDGARGELRRLQDLSALQVAHHLTKIQRNSIKNQ